MASWKLIFEEDFSDFSNWTDVNGVWSLDSSNYDTSPSSAYDTDTNNYNDLIHQLSNTLNNVQVKFSFYRSNTSANSYLILRDDSDTNIFLLGMRIKEIGDENHIMYCDGDTSSYIDTGHDPVLDAWQTFKVECNDGTFSIWHNGSLIVDSDPLHTTANVKSIKFITQGGDERFDTVEVYILSSPPTRIEGTIKERETDASGSQYDYAVIEPDFSTPSFTIKDANTSNTDGTFAVDCGEDNDNRHLELRLDSSGTYKVKVRDQLTPTEVDSEVGTSYSEPSFPGGGESHQDRVQLYNPTDGSLIDGGTQGFYGLLFYYPGRDISQFCFVDYATLDSNGDFSFGSLATGTYICVVVDPNAEKPPYAFEIVK